MTARYRRRVGVQRQADAEGGAAPSQRRVVLTVAAALAAVLALPQLADVGPAPDVVVLPAVGEVAPALLDDGTPVWIRHVVPGQPQIIEAVAVDTLPESTGGGVVGLVAWCPRGERFVAPHHGLSYSPDGRPYAVRAAGRLPPEAQPTHRLAGRLVEGVGGDGIEGDPVRVGEAVAADAEDPVRQLAGGTPVRGTPWECLRPVADASPPLGARPVDHSRFVSPLNELGRDGWHLAAGALIVSADGTAFWCADVPAGDPPSCAVPTDIPVDLGLSSTDTGGATAVLSGPVGLRSEGGVVVQAAALLGTTWRGSSLRGGFSYTGVWSSFTAELGLRLVPRPAGLADSCVGGWRVHASSSRPDGAIQAVGPDTRYDVAGVLDAASLEDTADRLVGTPLEILVDAATCRALRITG